MNNTIQREYKSIPDSGKNTTPMCELHFYKWLTHNKEQPFIDHKLDTIKAYMISLGLVPYSDFMCPDDVLIVSATYGYWWDVTIKPQLKINVEQQQVNNIY